jgi:hypothetical protein
MAGIGYLNSQWLELKRRILYSPEYNVMFLITAKCGSQFVKRFFINNFTDERWTKAKVGDKIECEPEDFDAFMDLWEKMTINEYNWDIITTDKLLEPGIKRFQIVRNPFARLVSLQQSNTTYKTDSLNSLVEIALDPLPHFHENKKGIIVNVARLIDHMYPQYSWLYSRYFQPIKLEDLSDILREIFPESEHKYPDLNDTKIFKHHSKKDYDWREYYRSGAYDTRQLMNNICELYHDDFHKFGYKNEL